MQFEWDPEKAARNLAKHEISFDEAQTVFDDPLFMEFFDPDHSQEEARYIILGESTRGRLLMVAYTERDAAARLISARRATKPERRIYEQKGHR